MKQINISEVVSQAWELTKQNWLAILVCVLGIGIVQYAIQAIFSVGLGIGAATMNFGAQPDIQDVLAMYAAMAPLSVITAIVNFILMVGLYQTLINCGRGNGEFSFQAWNQPLMVYLKVLGIQLLVGLICMIGCLFCILPGLYLAARLQFSAYYAIDHKNAGIMESITASWNMTQSSAFTLIGLFLLFICFVIVGFLCCCVGVIAAEILIYFCIIVSYLTLLNEPTSDEE